MVLVWRSQNACDIRYELGIFSFDLLIRDKILATALNAAHLCTGGFFLFGW